MKFGLYYVDLKNKERIPRRSVSVFGEIISHRSVDRKLIDKVKL
jgi:beta-glucosidase/6-phospho-beta-glucosidase/beta-galactosidase